MPMSASRCRSLTAENSMGAAEFACAHSPWQTGDMPNTLTPEELQNLKETPGWHLDTGQGTHTGTLEEVARVAHDRSARGEHPGIIRQLENSIELEMLQLEQLWMDLGLPH